MPGFDGIFLKWISSTFSWVVFPFNHSARPVIFFTGLMTDYNMQANRLTI